MENSNSPSKLYPNQSLPPPKRGQIKVKIFKGIFKSLASIAGGFVRRPSEYGAFLSSNPQTPADPKWVLLWCSIRSILTSLNFLSEHFPHAVVGVDSNFPSFLYICIIVFKFMGLIGWIGNSGVVVELCCSRVYDCRRIQAMTVYIAVWCNFVSGCFSVWNYFIFFIYVILSLFKQF